MILHICPPENKFIKSLVERFEKIKPGFNRCIVIVSSHHNNPATNIDRQLIEYFGPLNDEIERKIIRSDYDGVVVHTLTDDIAKLSLALTKRFKVLWRIWGTELHDILYPDIDLLLPHTQKLIYGRNNILNQLKKTFKPFYYNVSGERKTIAARRLRKIELLKSVNYIASATFTEYKLLKEKVPEIKAGFLPLNYRSLDLQKLPVMKSGKNSEMIMVGHSSYSYHNHSDVFYQIKENLFEGKITVPLNYGDPEYRQKLIKIGQSLFKGSINFVTEFLKFDDYLEFIQKFDAFILNSKVQSGGGNIIYFLFQGSKVFLREENPAYQEYKKYGIKLFSIERDLQAGNMLFEDLSWHDRKVNREIIENLYNSEREKENVINVYKAFSLR